MVPAAFVFVDGQTYEASKDEMVWGVSGANEAPPAEWHKVIDLGQIEGGCIASYVGIDDDEDHRINSFELDGQLIEEVSQGMVFSGSFVIPHDGNLVFIANDSVGGWFASCDERVPTETPPPTPSPTATSEAGPPPYLIQLPVVVSE